MHVASPTDVPPNFITCNGFAIVISLEINFNDNVPQRGAGRETSLHVLCSKQRGGSFLYASPIIMEA